MPAGQHVSGLYTCTHFIKFYPIIKRSTKLTYSLRYENWFELVSNQTMTTWHNVILKKKNQQNYFEGSIFLRANYRLWQAERVINVIITSVSPSVRHRVRLFKLLNQY